MQKIPAAVVVMTDTGHVIANDMRGDPLTVEEATAMAREYNDACKPEHRTAVVRELVPVGETRCTACGDPVGSVCWRCA